MIYAYQISIHHVNEDNSEDLQKIPLNVEYSLLWKQKTNDMISKLELFATGALIIINFYARVSSSCQKTSGELLSQINT